MGLPLSFAGQPKQAIEQLKRAMRLNPAYPAWYPWIQGWAQVVAEQYEASIASSKEAAVRFSDVAEIHRNLAVAYHYLGRTSEARLEAEESRRIDPEFTLDDLEASLPFADSADLERFLLALRESGLPEHPHLPLPDKPSIAVLPFTNMSGDAEQEYFVDGITEDIITDISKISGLFVVARNSTFTYKGKAVKIRQVAEDLGVRYVLEGSVRRSGEQIRITAQLIDALSGNHVWADRYDRDLENVFKVQSEVAQQVAKALAVTLKANEIERLFQEYTTNIDAYDVFLKARRAVDLPSKDNILRGEKLFKQVIELDPNFAGGYAGLSFNYSVQIRFKYSNSPASHLADAFELANKAIEIDPSYTWGYIALGGAHLANVDAYAAVDAVRQALILEPNSYEANLFMGFYLQFAGDAARAVEHLQIAKRLSPVESVRSRAFMALAQFMNRNYTELIRISWSTTPSGKVVLAAAYTLLEKPEKAAEAVKDLLDTYPNFNLSQWKLTRLKYWQSEENRTRLYNAAKKAGIPEFPKGQ
jgi:TolB-like protein/lipopolysaccharide biosynthesis regulator YciM